MKTILSAVLFASFLLAGPAFAGEGKTTTEGKPAPAPTDKKDTKPAPTQKDGKADADAARLRGK